MATAYFTTPLPKTTISLWTAWRLWHTELPVETMQRISVITSGMALVMATTDWQAMKYFLATGTINAFSLHKGAKAHNNAISHVLLYGDTLEEPSEQTPRTDVLKNILTSKKNAPGKAGGDIRTRGYVTLPRGPARTRRYRYRTRPSRP